MGGPFVMSTEVNYSDVQGLVRFGYGKLKGAKYALARVSRTSRPRDPGCSPRRSPTP